MDGPANLFGQIQDLAPRGTAQIHQNQGLLVMDSSPSHTPAFPATALDHPAGSQFELVAALGVVGQIGKPPAQAGKCAVSNHRVFKKTARIADPVGVRQFALPNGDDGLTDGLQINRTQIFYGRFDARIVQDEFWLPVELENHRRDDKRTGPATFEVAGAVAESAGPRQQGYFFTACDRNGLDAVDNILCLGSVCTDILHRTGADASRNERQVLDA